MASARSRPLLLGALLRAAYASGGDLALESCADPGDWDSVSLLQRKALLNIRVKAFYVSVDTSSSRARCMQTQLRYAAKKLSALGVELDAAPWPAVVFRSCVDKSTCLRERPQCFPTGNIKAATHEYDNTTSAMRGVLGNWCSHLNLLQALEGQANKWDYFFIFEDDAILLPSFGESVAQLLRTISRDLTLVAFDTYDITHGWFSTHERRAKKGGLRRDLIKGASLPLYTFPARKQANPKCGAYCGAHAWLLSAAHVGQFLEFYQTLDAIPVDHIPLVKHPRHSFLAYQPMAVRQKRFMNAAEIKGLPEPCQTEHTSDIVEPPATNESGEE